MIRILPSRFVHQACSVGLNKMPPQQVSKLKGRMFSVQAALPKFPVAPLDQTLDKYLRTVRPLLSEEEYVNTEKLCAEFKEGVGKTLQSKLHERANKHTNWMADWWRDYAYLDVRTPCVINSNPGVLFPRSDFNDLNGQLEYASRLTAGLLNYKSMIDSQTLPIDQLGKNPLCMMQYYQILSACRTPGLKHDTWACYPPDKPGAPKHITVMYRNNIFEVPVYGEDGLPMSVDQIKGQLHFVVNEGTLFGDPVGLLTMEHRTNWAKVYKKLLKEKRNKLALESMSRSIVTLCLDEPLNDHGDLMSPSGHQMLHGAGSSKNSGNRWFDKTLQFIVGQNGFSGLNYEHTTAEGPPIISIMDHSLNFIQKGKDNKPARGLPKPKQLHFKLTSDTEKAIVEAKENCDRMVSDVDLNVFIFDEFGKNFPKSQKLSPDSFIQNAIQLAYYRNHLQPAASYESASIRMFQLGRTDTIRSCSLESLEFTKAMLDDVTPANRKAELLRKAVQSHKNYTNDAITGKGIDRHLLGLKLAAIENNMDIPALFMDPAYSVSGTWKISTSQVPAKSESVLFFGPVVPDGYGFCYNPQENRILFGISSFKSCNSTLTAEKMSELIGASLRDMRDVLATSLKSNL